jgi:hypothetical protein
VGTIPEYLTQPNVSLYSHVKNAKEQLRIRVRGMKAIYLDTMIWIHLRDLRIGRTSRLPFRFDKFSNLLIQAVERDKVVCAISEQMLFEVSKQSDPSTRRSTLALMTDLSRDISVVVVQERHHLELANLLQWGVRPIDLAEKSNVWIKAAYVMGERHPVPNPEYFDEASQLAMQKAFFDRMWQVPVFEYFDHGLGPDPEYESLLSDLSRNMTKESRRHASELAKYRDAFDAECVGMAEILSDNIFDEALDCTDSEIANHFRLLRGLSAAEFRSAKVEYLSNKLDPKNGHAALPSAYVQASLHASKRWNKEQAFKENDHYDIDHAVAALPYFDAFFTEKSLTTAIKQKHLQLDQKFKCHVACNVDDMIEFLEKIS